MSLSHLLQLGLLAALWGGSYVCMRLGAFDFGAVPLAGARAGIAALLLLPLLFRQTPLGTLRRKAGPLMVVALAQSTLPFLLFNFAAVHLPPALAAILTATTALFSALLARVWLGEQLTPSRIAGLALGFGGVLWLVWERIDLSTGSSRLDLTLASAACLFASLLYAFAGHYARQKLHDVAPLSVAASCQGLTAAVLAGPAAASWPVQNPSAPAWGALLVLAIACTAVAYYLFFRLIGSIGAARTATVTYLIPLFAQLWSFVVFREIPSTGLVAGGMIVLAGTALSTGAVALPGFRRARSAAS